MVRLALSTSEMLIESSMNELLSVYIKLPEPIDDFSCLIELSFLISEDDSFTLVMFDLDRSLFFLDFF